MPLRGAKDLLRSVESLFIEYWPRGLRTAGVTGDELVRYVVTQGFACFDADGAEAGRASESAAFERFFIENTVSSRWGRYGNILCLNTRAIDNEMPPLKPHPKV